MSTSPRKGLKRKASASMWSKARPADTITRDRPWRWYVARSDMASWDGFFAWEEKTLGAARRHAERCAGIIA